MNDFCCNSFKFFYLTDKNRGLNITIAKLHPNVIERAGFAFDKVFYITEGYTGSVDQDNIKKTTINYCPFCGTKLLDFYKSDDYAQETVGG